mmetsp:Transcript_71949/g.159224  ORF Transcript_71949/g.159224 Transcript_71949/m.159224 type:complete len:527 (+) Transcript_71949:89-1669(+)
MGSYSGVPRAEPLWTAGRAMPETTGVTQRSLTAKYADPISDFMACFPGLPRPMVIGMILTAFSLAAISLLSGVALYWVGVTVTTYTTTTTTTLTSTLGTTTTTTMTTTTTTRTATATSTTVTATATTTAEAEVMEAAMFRSFDGEFLCNPRLHVDRSVRSGSMQIWKLPEEVQKHCYAAIKQSPLGGVEDPKGRNWCWVALKERGCHATLWNNHKARPHFTWEEMRQKVVRLGAMPQTPTFEPLQDPQVCDSRDLGKAEHWSLRQWAAARKWFSDNVAVYVLNLPANHERWKFLSSHLERLHINATRVWGIDLRNRGALESAKREGLLTDSFDFKVAQASAKTDWNRMGGILGTVGCAAAHFRAQKAALKARKERPLAVVLEDDAVLAEDFVPRLWSIVKEELPCDWGALSLRSMCPYGRCVSRHLTRVEPDLNEPWWRCHHGVNYGFQGMLYNLEQLHKFQDKWKKTVFDERRPHCLDIDVALASISDTVVFYAVPFVQQPGLLREEPGPSSRFDINIGEKTTPV